MKYLVYGPTIMNDIVYADGTTDKYHMGGVVFCMAGIKLWDDDVRYISNVGDDFEKYFGKWMDDNHFSRDGLKVILPHTMYTELRYGEMNLFTETCIYGEKENTLIVKLDHPDAGWIASFCGKETKGIYVEAMEDDVFWDSLDVIREKGDIKIMWEIPTASALEEDRREQTLKTIRKAGLFSINLPESMSLFDAKSEEEAIEKILQFGVPCFFRVGEKGSYFLCDNKSHFAASVTVGDVEDPTGCGNCSTAAAMYGYCEGKAPGEAAMIGNISAAYNLLQYGPYPKFTADTREQALELLRQRLA